MKENFKKYWFIGLVAILLLSSIVYFASETNKSIDPGKRVNGENIIYAIDGNDITANQLYDKLYDANGVARTAQLFQQHIIDLKIETTDELLDRAKEISDQQIASLKQKYGADFDTEIVKLVNSLGFKKENELYKYFLTQIKASEVVLLAAEEQFDDFNEKQKPRIMSHVLVKMEDPENPTEEELKKIADIDASIADGTDFGEVAKLYSDDTSSAQGGLLGYQDLTSINQMVEPFRAPGFEIKAGEMTEWITTEYGRHIIYINETGYDELLEQYPEEFTNAILTYYPEWVGNFLFDAAEEFNVEFTDKEMEAKIRKEYGLTDDESSNDKDGEEKDDSNVEGETE